MKQKIKKILLSLSTNKLIDKSQINQFLKRVGTNVPLTKENSLDDHICSFFVPVDKKTKSIYIGHHIKADRWIPPGGHVKENEDPLETVYREFTEELNHKLTIEKIDLFDLSKRILEPNPRHRCKIHYDFWFAVYTDKLNFDFIKKEFYDARWFSVEEGLKKINVPQYNKIVKKLSLIL